MTDASPAAEERFYRQAMRRIYLHVLWLSLAGALAAGWWHGTAAALGFLLGAGASALNFRWLHRLVDSLGPDRPPPGKGLGAVLSLRYLLFAVVGYVIVKYFDVNLMAALLGLFVAVAAVFVEVLYELIYARA